jgi:hypothetical protein
MFKLTVFPGYRRQPTASPLLCPSENLIPGRVRLFVGVANSYSGSDAKNFPFRDDWRHASGQRPQGFRKGVRAAHPLNPGVPL